MREKPHVMFRLLWEASTRVRDVLRYAPSNIVLYAIRARRRGLKWGLPAMLLAVPYWLAAMHFVALIKAGGDAWLNLLVLWAGWNAIKFVMIGPVSVVLLIRVRIAEAIERQRARRAAASAAHGTVGVARRTSSSTREAGDSADRGRDARQPSPRRST